MFAKVVLVALFAVSFTQTNAAVTYKPVGGIIDDAKKLLSDLTSSVTVAIKDGVDQLTVIGNETALFAGEIIDQATFKVQEESRKLLEQLSEIKENAKQAGIDISDCLEDRETGLTDLPGKYLKIITTCVGDKTKETIEIIANTTTTVKDIILDVEADKEALEKCGTGVESLACTTKLYAKMGLQITQIPFKITGEVTNAGKLATDKGIEIQKCSVDSSANLVIEGTAIIQEISDCVDKKKPKPKEN